MEMDLEERLTRELKKKLGEEGLYLEPSSSGNGINWNEGTLEAGYSRTKNKFGVKRMEIQWETLHLHQEVKSSDNARNLLLNRCSWLFKALTKLPRLSVYHLVASLGTESGCLLLKTL